MKRLMVTAMLLFASAMFAQSAAVVDNAPRNFAKALCAENPGMVESALFHVLKYRVAYPEKDLRGVEETVARLMTGGATERIRFRAHLAWQYLTTERLQERISPADFRDVESFFRSLAVELNHSLLAGS